MAEEKLLEAVLLLLLVFLALREHPQRLQPLHQNFDDLLGRRPDAPLDGVDLQPLWKGGSPPDALRERALFFHVPHRQLESAIRSDRFKLIHHFNGPDELYDLASDPSEATNLAAEDAGRADALREELLSWLEDVGARMPVSNPAYRDRDQG